MKGPEGQPKGFGFVSYGSAEDAAKAISGMSGFYAESAKFLKVSIKKGEEQHAAPVPSWPRGGNPHVPVTGGTSPLGATICIFHMPTAWNENEVHRHFIHYGTMLNVTVMRQGNENVGFVGFEHVNSANRACEGMTGFVAGDGKALKVVIKGGEEETAIDAGFGLDADLLAWANSIQNAGTPNPGLSVQSSPVQPNPFRANSMQAAEDPFDGFLEAFQREGLLEGLPMMQGKGAMQWANHSDV